MSNPSALAQRIAAKCRRKVVFDEGPSFEEIIDAELADVQISEGWRSIVDAPKDGRDLLLWIPGRGMVIGYWNKKRNDGCWWQAYAMTIKPTRFMPLPAQPEGKL